MSKQSWWSKLAAVGQAARTISITRRLAGVDKRLAENAVRITRYEQLLALASRHPDVMHRGHKLPKHLERASISKQVDWRIAEFERRARQHGLLSELDGPAAAPAKEKS